MKDYIERAAAVDMFTAAEKEGPGADFPVIKRMLANLPAADVVEVRHGRWKRHLQSDNVNPVYVCGLCKLNVSGFEKRWIKYCPNCGALMQEEDNGEK